MADDVRPKAEWLAGELAKATGVSTDTLRHYERKQVLARPRRAANGYRLYPLEALERVQLVRRALAVGFTLDELAVILRERDGGGAPCEAVHRLATEKLAAVEQQLEDLTSLREDLKGMLDGWATILSKTGKRRQSRLLEHLPDRKASSPNLIKRKIKK